jgi:hypothetical protein
MRVVRVGAARVLSSLEMLPMSALALCNQMILRF